MQCPRSLKRKSYYKDSETFSRSDVIVGEGAYGVVYKGSFGSKPCALKYIRSYLFQSVSANEYTMEKFERECEFAEQMSASPYIVQFFGVSFHDHVPVLITELMECSLTEVLNCHYCGVAYHREIDIALGIARGLDYLHSHRPPVVHRDLSSNNVLLASDYSVKLADLGVAKCVDASSCSPMPGTTVYMPPEVVKHTELSIAIDLFSYAVVLVQLETRKFPCPADKVERLVQDSGDVREGRGEGEGGEEGEDGGEKEMSRREERQASEENRRCEDGEESSLPRFRTRSELERRANHIQLTEETGVFHKIVMCYLQDSAQLRTRTSLAEVIVWLEEETNTPRYMGSVQSNPEIPLEHKTSNHRTRTSRPPLSVSSGLPTPQRGSWWQRMVGKRASGGDDSGYHSQQYGTHTIDQSSNEWQLVEGQVPSDSSSRGILGAAVYSLNRLSNVLGLTAGDEDDSEYKMRVLKGL